MFYENDRKHCGKRRNCSLRAISPFPTVFSKDLNYRHVKTRACLGKGLSDDKTFAATKLKAHADDKSDTIIAKMIPFFLSLLG